MPEGNTPQLRLTLLSKDQKAEAKPLVNSDAHNKTNLLTLTFAKTNPIRLD